MNISLTCSCEATLGIQGTPGREISVALEVEKWSRQHDHCIRARQELADEVRLHLENEAKSAATIIGLKDKIGALTSQNRYLVQQFHQKF